MEEPKQEPVEVLILMASMLGMEVLTLEQRERVENFLMEHRCCGQYGRCIHAESSRN